MKPLITVLLTAIFFSDSLAQQSNKALTTFNPATVQNGFLKNTGQVTDFKNKPVDFVYYQANLNGQQVFITRYGLSLLLSRPLKMIRVQHNFHGLKMPSKKDLVVDSSWVVDYELERIDITLKKATILVGNMVAKANDRSPVFNFYTDSPDTKAQQLSNEILVKNVYPGIDWKVYIKEEKGKSPTLKYDFIVHPGADPSQIKIHYSNNTKLALANNEINGTSKMGTVRELKPYTYQQEDKVEVPMEYALQNNTISFKTTFYNKSNTLVIDPSIFWMTYLTSKIAAPAYRAIMGNDIETDANGNIFVQLSGEANCPFPTVNPGGGAYYQEMTAAPNGAMIISKFATGGQLIWSTYFGNGVAGRQMTIDKFGNITAVGRLLDPTTTVPDQHSSIPLKNNGGFYDGVQKKYFITKFSNSGVLQWSSYYADFSTYTSDMTYDANGNVYVVGWSQVYDFPVVDPGGGAYVVKNAQYGYAQVLFISQFDASNRLTWSTRIEGNSDDDLGARVCTDKVGNIYLAGNTRSSNYPLVNGGGYYNPAAWGAVITKFNPARQMTWSTYFPYAYGVDDVTTDDSCNLYVLTDKLVSKFDSSTRLGYEKAINTNKMYFWNKINYDPVHDQLQLLGVMNESYLGFPAINTVCNGSFFYDGSFPQIYNNATGPIFATMGTNGEFSYLSLADWVYEYYDQNEMAIDAKGDPVYLFGYQQDGYTMPNPQLTDPGNGAYFDSTCCYLSNSNSSAFT